MSEILSFYIVTLVFICVLICLLSLFRWLVSNKYIKAEQRLRLKLNEATSYFKGNSEHVPDFMQKAIGGIGIEGIMTELGIDPKILNNPLIKGLVDKYAPKLLETLEKGNKSNETPGLL